jgi:hypothetical protein
MSNNRIVDVVIKKGSRGISSANFSTPLFLTDTGKGEVETFLSLTGVTDAGYATNSEVYGAASAHFSQSGYPAIFKVADWDGVDDIKETLSGIKDVDNQWYGLIIDDISKRASFLDAADWCVDNKKFMFAVDNIASMLESSDTTSVAGTINTVGKSKACCLYNEVARTDTSESSYADVAFASAILGRTIGSYTGEFKTLSGMTTDNLLEADRLNLYGKNAVVFNELYGRDVVQNARVLDSTTYDPATGIGGEWIDIEIGLDWLEARMTEAVVKILINSEKVPYTAEGISLLKSAVSQILQIAKDRGFLSDYVVKSERAEDQSTEDRQARIYNGISWTATLAGAIHATTINGTVEV